MNNYVFIVRQVVSSNGNALATARTESTQVVNMRRYKVNAQVTALICILEMVGAITFSIHRSFTGPTIDTLLHGQFTYFILMPYAFLMNTSRNKNRIIEHGWKNVFRNMIGITIHPSSCNRVLPCPDKDNAHECDNDNVSNIDDNQLDVSEGSTDNDGLIVTRIFSISQQSLDTDRRPTINVPHPGY